MGSPHAWIAWRQAVQVSGVYANFAGSDYTRAVRGSASATPLRGALSASMRAAPLRHRPRGPRAASLALPLAWVVVSLGLASACEREGDAPVTASPSTATATAAPMPGPAVAAALEPAASVEPENPAPPTTEPTAAGDPAQVERVLAEYHRIDRFLGPLPEGSEPSETDQKRLREYLGEKDFAWYESSGWSTAAIRHAWLVRMAEQAVREPPSTIRMPLYPNVGWGLRGTEHLGRHRQLRSRRHLHPACGRHDARA